MPQKTCLFQFFLIIKGEFSEVAKSFTHAIYPVPPGRYRKFLPRMKKKPWERTVHCDSLPKAFEGMLLS